MRNSILTNSNLIEFRIQWDPSLNEFLFTSHIYTIIVLILQVPCIVDANNEPLDSKHSKGVAAVWVARNRFAVLGKTHKLTIKHIVNNENRIIEFDKPVNDIFYAGTGFLLLSNTYNVKLYDIKQECVIATAKAPKVYFFDFFGIINNFFEIMNTASHNSPFWIWFMIQAIRFLTTTTILHITNPIRLNHCHCTQHQGRNHHFSLVGNFRFDPSTVRKINLVWRFGRECDFRFQLFFWL